MRLLITVASTWSHPPPPHPTPSFAHPTFCWRVAFCSFHYKYKPIILNKRLFCLFWGPLLGFSKGSQVAKFGRRSWGGPNPSNCLVSRYVESSLLISGQFLIYFLCSIYYSRYTCLYFFLFILSSYFFLLNFLQCYSVLSFFRFSLYKIWFYLNYFLQFVSSHFVSSFVYSFSSWAYYFWLSYIQACIIS